MAASRRNGRFLKGLKGVRVPFKGFGGPFGLI